MAFSGMGHRLDEHSEAFTGLSVLIPFKNEKANLKVLARKIQLVSRPPYPVEFIFINDGSTDGSEKELSRLETFSLLSLPTNQSGKKAAIRSGVEASGYSHILTLDADVRLRPDFFILLQPHLRSPRKMTIFGITPSKQKGFASAFFDLEFISLQGVNAFLASQQYPLMANGACLLFEKQAFLHVDSSRKDYHIPTGDDVFLLKSIEREYGRRSIGMAPLEMAMEAGFPNGFFQLFHQRSRWISKTLEVEDLKYRFFAFAMAFVHLAFLPISIFLITIGRMELGLGVLGLKLMGEWILFARLLPRFKRNDLFYAIPIAQLLYPFYLVSLIIAARSKRSNYKANEFNLVEKI